MDNTDTIFTLALTFFLVANPIGNTPAILALVKDYDFEKQKKIMIREGLFALLIAIFFQFFGEVFLNMLNIKDYAITLCGGTLLFLVALSMIFSSKDSSNQKPLPKQEPFFVPIATPILTGPGLMAVIMLKSREEEDAFRVLLAILLAFAGVLLIMAVGPYLKKIFGTRGLAALEQLMGMILALISMEMIVKGTTLFLKTLG